MKEGYGQRSKRWLPHEFIVVEGIPCVYSVSEAGVMVFRPGRAPAPLVELKNRGLDVQEPKRWRVGDFTAGAQRE